MSGIGEPVTTHDIVTSRPSVAMTFSRFRVNFGGTPLNSGAVTISVVLLTASPLADLILHV